MRAFAPSLALWLALAPAAAAAATVRVVAAENVYGDLARQIGGGHVEVTSILSNPNQDPHLFEASPGAARAIAAADVLIANGADYDPWMDKLAAASPKAGRRAIDVGAIVGAKQGANPHLWYAPANMRTAAKALAEALAAADPADAADFHAGAATFADSLRDIDATIAEMRAHYKGMAIAATEPVFDYAAQAIGLDVREKRFALAVMNDTEPSPSDVAAFETDLKTHKVRVLIYNSQASEPAVERLVALAEKSGVAVVGVSETEPRDADYQAWMKQELDALDHSLGEKFN